MQLKTNLLLCKIMKKITVVFLVSLISNIAFAQYPPVAWAKKFEGVDVLNPQCAIDVNAVDEQGAIYCSGYFRDTLRPDQNQTTNYLIGNSNWDSGAFIKYDANGNLIFAKSILAHVGYFYVTDLAIDQTHNIYVLCQGVYTDTIDFDPSPATAYQVSDGNDFFIAKYDENGNYLWSKIINVTNGNNTFSNRPNKIKVDNNNNIFIGGRFQNQIDLDPSAASLTITNPGGVNCNCTVGFYAKYDANGNVIWGIADVNNSSVNDIDVNESNGQILIGATGGSFSGQTLRLCDALGTSLNSLSSARIKVDAVKFDTDGNFYFSGSFNSSGNDFDWGPASFTMSTTASYIQNGFVGKYDNAGNFLWAEEYDPTLDPNFDAYTYRINIDAENSPFLAFSEENGNGYQKGFYKLNPSNGAPIWSNVMFNVLVGLNTVNIVPSPADGTIVFGAGVGFSGNQIMTVDADPDPNTTLNVAGKGYWSLLAKYGNCSAPPTTPSVIAGNNALCDTNSITYTVDLQLGVSSYNWTLPLGWTGTSTSNSITVLPSSNSGTIEVFANNLCGSSPLSSLQISYVGAPSVVANSTANQICFGDSVVLTGSGADTYTWNNNVLNGIAITPSTTATYTVTGNLNGCENTDSIVVTVNPLPIVELNLASIDTLCQDAGVVALIGGIPVGGTYSGIGVTANSFDALTSGAGNYEIIYQFTDANNCTSNAADSIYVDVCTGFDNEFLATDWNIYPNPCESEFIIFVNNISNEMWVTDLLGKIVVQKVYNQTQLKLNIGQSGVYIVFVKTKDGISQRKLIVK